MMYLYILGKGRIPDQGEHVRVRGGHFTCRVVLVVIMKSAQ